MEDFIYKNLLKFLDDKLYIDNSFILYEENKNDKEIKWLYKLHIERLDVYREVKAKLLELNDEYWKLVGNSNTNQINRLIDET